MSGPALVGLAVAGDADAWRAAGFTVDPDGVCRIGHVRVQTGVGDTGISAWTLGAEPTVEPAEHPNGTVLLDHLVVFTDDPQRSVLSYADLGLQVRRVRDLGNGKTQTFFRAGEVIIELVGPMDGTGDAGERLFGLSPTVSDLDVCGSSATGSERSRTRPNRAVGSRPCATRRAG